MCVIEVEPHSLGDLGLKLKRAAAEAERVHLIGSSFGQVNPSLVGSPRLAWALSGFFSDWSYGCRFLAGDADKLAALLARAGRVYLDVESAIAGIDR